MIPLVPDHYTRQARLFPALLVMLPVGLAIVAWFPQKFIGWGLLLGVATSCGLTALLAQIGRDLGKSKEPKLHEKWNGKPTTQFLRCGDTHIDQFTKARYKEKLRELIPTIVFPGPEEESNAPAAADEIYASCTKFLLEKTRDKKRFDLLYNENVNYGFRRNIWGMKPAGILLAIGGLIVTALPIYLARTDVPAVAVIATLLNVILLIWWILRITPN
ncbi:MAG: hypothetical protein PHS73_01855 [Candidatus Peribacteraceae bacterium]|nr:hypothetical protein [Candidatus Peribacteraceae bacterium]